MRGRSAALLTVATLCSGAKAAYGCPYCDSAIGRQVWAGIFNEDFFWNATLVGLPIPILIVLVLMIRFAPLPSPQTGRGPRSFASGEDR